MAAGFLPPAAIMLAAMTAAVAIEGAVVMMMVV
jgi:hypothetical protein